MVEQARSDLCRGLMRFVFAAALLSLLCVLSQRVFRRCFLAWHRSRAALWGPLVVSLLLFSGAQWLISRFVGVILPAHFLLVKRVFLLGSNAVRGNSCEGLFFC